MVRLLRVKHGIVMFQEHCSVYDVVCHCILMVMIMQFILQE